jgi:hypothetical protein
MNDYVLDLGNILAYLGGMNNEELASYFAGTANMLNSLADKVETIRLTLVATIPQFAAEYQKIAEDQEQHSTVASLETRPSSPEQALQVAHLIADLRSRKVQP